MSFKRKDNLDRNYLQAVFSHVFTNNSSQGLCQDLETGLPILAIVTFWGVQFCKEDPDILRLQP